jgi:acetolactate synthase-1/2/3 large subunit
MCGIVDGAHIPLVSRWATTASSTSTRTTRRRPPTSPRPTPAWPPADRGRSATRGRAAPTCWPGLTSAHGEGHPVVAIACTRRSATTQPERAGAWQATDLVDMAKPITKYSALIARADRVPELIRAAFRAATTGRPGPAFLAIPDELLARRSTPRPCASPRPPATGSISMGAGDPAAIERAADALANAERPFLYAGKGVAWAGAAAEFVALGDHLAAAMSTSLGARGVVPEDHPHYFHIFDMTTTTDGAQRRRRGAGGGRPPGRVRRLGHAPGLGRPRRPAHDPDRLRPDVDRPQPAGGRGGRGRRQGPR